MSGDPLPSTEPDALENAETFDRYHPLKPSKPSFLATRVWGLCAPSFRNAGQPMFIDLPGSALKTALCETAAGIGKVTS
jgi:hypothetical protein